MELGQHQAYRACDMKYFHFQPAFLSMQQKNDQKICQLGEIKLFFCWADRNPCSYLEKTDSKLRVWLQFELVCVFLRHVFFCPPFILLEMVLKYPHNLDQTNRSFNMLLTENYMIFWSHGLDIWLTVLIG